MSHFKSYGLKIWLVLLLFAVSVSSVFAQGKGWLVIEGGSNPLNPVVAERFRQLIGGADAEVLLVPTAGDDERIQKEIETGGVAKLANEQLGIKNYKLFHTRDRNQANSEAFVAPLKTAHGVWFIGGRPGRLAQAYVGTRTQRDLQAFYDRGGVVGGLSAGAMIMSSFLVRGGIEDLKALVVPDNHIGFGLLPNTVIDSHVNQRANPGDLVEVVDAHPELLGIGIDAGTAVIVHGHSFEVIGGPDARATITDGKQHDGKPYYFLKLGDRFNLDKRTLE